MLSGIPYGIGVEMTFMSLTNYLTDAYDIFAASAMASCVFTRNIIAALVLPLATYRMYQDLGVDLSCSILGALGLIVGLIPLIFLYYGPALRSRSAFCQKIKVRREQRHGEGLVWGKAIGVGWWFTTFCWHSSFYVGFPDRGILR